MSSTQCIKCAAWSVSEFTYQELCKQWEELIGGKITEGYLKRFKKEGLRCKLPYEEISLPFKFCSRGMLTRFYVVKGPNGIKPKKVVHGCPEFTESRIQAKEFPVPSPLWTVCQKESHGKTKVKGLLFFPGLYENRVYFRIPAHGQIEPEIVDDGTCDICGNDFGRGIVITEVKHFCCNIHYLQWWREMHPDEYLKFNDAKGNSSE